MMAQVRLGVIGCGRVAQRVHLRALLTLKNAVVTAVADPDQASRERALERARASDQSQRQGQAPPQAFEDPAQMLDHDNVDAVVICSPPPTHAQLAANSIARGRHVYVEKPLAPSVEQAKPLIDAWHASPVIGMVGFNYRRQPLIEELKYRLAKGQIGQAVAARTLFTAARRKLPGWKTQRRTGGGALLDLASHHLDLLGYLFDSPITEVAGSFRSVHSQQDTALLTVRLGSGVEAQLSVSISASDGDRIDLIGDAGMLSMDRFRSRRVEHQGPNRPSTRAQRLRSAASSLTRVRDAAVPAVEPSHKLALQAFVDAVAASPDQASQEPPIQPDLAAGLTNLRIIEAAERSANQAGGFVAVEEG